jgi:hypothetical protein
VQLPGKLEKTTLGDLLGTLYRAEITGCLVLTDSRLSAHRVRLVAGRPSAIQTSLDAPLLGELLLSRRADARLRNAIERLSAGSPAGPLGDALVAQGFVTRDELARAITEQTQARLDALFELKTASVRLALRETGWILSGTTPLGPECFLHGRPRAGRARDSASRPVPSTRVAALNLLGLAGHTPSEPEIRRAFRQLAAKLHPDRGAAGPGPEERARRTHEFAQLTAAFHALVA